MPTTTEPETLMPPQPAPLPFTTATTDGEPPARAEGYVRLPTVRTLTARVVVTGRLRPLPLPELDD